MIVSTLSENERTANDPKIGSYNFQENPPQQCTDLTTYNSLEYIK
jgi:hypothetical protein